MPAHNTLPTPDAQIAVIGAGWAGCAAAVRATQLGARVTVFEASRTAGGRARSVHCTEADGDMLDNGQHILIGAYTQTLELMRTIGASPDALFQRLPLDLRTPDGHGLQLRPASSAQLAALRAIVRAQGWNWREKWRLLRAAAQWRLQGFSCPDHYSVADLCQGLGAVVFQSLIEPLCIAAFNSAPHETSGAVFLRVLQDALFSTAGASDALIARTPFGQLLPEPALAWLQAHSARIALGQRVQALRPTAHGWQLTCGATSAHDVSETLFDSIILACPAWEASRLVQGLAQDSLQGDPQGIQHLQQWVQQANALQHVPIATLYAWCPSNACAQLPPMQSLVCTSKDEAQFVFHHAHRQRMVGDTGKPETLLAFVASHCTDDRQALEAAIATQAREQLGLPALQIIRTTIEKRATFICRPALQRPAMRISTRLWACGDYVHGPYPATLEGAVRSGLQAANACCAALS